MEKYIKNSSSSSIQRKEQNTNSSQSNTKIAKDISSHETEEDKQGLSLKKKLKIISTIFASFIICGILFFPYQKIINYYFFKLINQNALGVGETDLSIMGISHLSNLNYTVNETTGIEATKVAINIPLLSFITNSLDGTVQFNDIYFYSKYASFIAKKAVIVLDLNDFSLPVNEWQGKININVTGLDGVKLKIPQLEPLGIDLNEIKINKIVLKLSFDESKLAFDGSEMTSNYFDLKLKGHTHLSQNFSKSRLKNHICITPKPNLETLNPALMGILLAGGASVGTEMCFKLNGTPSKPDFILPFASGFGSSTSTDTSSDYSSKPSPGQQEAQIKNKITAPKKFKRAIAPRPNSLNNREIINP